MEDKKKRRDFYPFFNQKGKANFFLDGDQKHIHAMSGEPVAFVDKGAVFGYDGVHLGWFEEGWLRDHAGKCVAMVEPAGKMGPNPPKARKPDQPADKQEPPEPPEIKEHPPRPAKKALWSEGSDKEFFRAKKA